MELVRSGRDADATRRALVRAARRRFATDGYRATTVRRIAADAGVNVALINRYFGSKEGLFEACIHRTVEELGPETTDATDDLAALIRRLISHVVDSPNADDPLQLLLLLRSSGDEHADALRRRTLQSFAQNLAASAGWSPDDPATAPMVLRAQIAIGAMIGLVMLRSSIGAEPAASATAVDLELPLSDLLRTLLAPSEAPGH